MLTLYCWLVGLKQQVDQFGSSSLPATLAIVTDKVPFLAFFFSFACPLPLFCLPSSSASIPLLFY